MNRGLWTAGYFGFTSRRAGGRKFVHVRYGIRQGYFDVDWMATPAEVDQLPSDGFHSPDGWEWGYAGSGPTQLARDLMFHYLGGPCEMGIYRALAGNYVQFLARDESWELEADQIDDFLENWFGPSDEWAPKMTREELASLVTVATVPSRSDKSRTYTVKMNPTTQELSCDCPGWIYSKRDPRSCRHTIVFAAVAEALVDKEKRVDPSTRFKKLSAAEVDRRNQEEFGSARPLETSPGSANTPNASSTSSRKTATSGGGTSRSRSSTKAPSTTSPLPRQPSLEIRTTIRTITFEEDEN